MTPQNSNDIADTLESYIRHHFHVTPTDAQFTRQGALFDLGYIDSVGVVELLEFIAESFGVDIPDDDLLSDDFSTIDGMANTIWLRMSPSRSNVASL